MSASQLVNCDILTPLEILPRTQLLIDGGRIVAVGDAALVENAGRVDLSGLMLAPGFIDVHVHGGGRQTIAAAQPDALRAYGRQVTQYGVTGYLAGVIGRSPERVTVALARGVSQVGNTDDGAVLLGFHVEGPFLSPVRRGAFNPAWLCAPTLEVLTRFVRAADGHLRLLTLAPELDGALPVIREAVRSGVMPSLGHTDADYEGMRGGFDAGARHVTHCFNAMRPFGHRDPGPIAAALTADDVFCEVIADGVHVAPGALRLLLAARGVERTVLVTDGIELAGETAGSFNLAGQSVSLRDGRALTPDGTLAGSVATMDECVRNAVALAGASVLEAVRMATLNAAQAAGCAVNRGRIAPGFRADLTALTPDLRVAMTWVNGLLVFNAAR